MVKIQPTVSRHLRHLEPAFLCWRGPAGHRGWDPMVVSQAIWWPFDQQGNVATSQNNIFNAGSVIYLAGFCVLMFALIGVHGRQAHKAGRLSTFGFSAAVLGTMLLGGDLWFESFAVPWLAEGPFPEVLKSDPSILFALGAIASYWLFAIGWVSFGLVSLRARVFPRLDLRLYRRRWYRRLPGFAFAVGDSSAWPWRHLACGCSGAQRSLHNPR